MSVCVVYCVGRAPPPAKKLAAYTGLQFPPVMDEHWLSGFEVEGCQIAEGQVFAGEGARATQSVGE